MTIKRRDFVTSMVATGLAVPATAQPEPFHHARLSGPLANATVSFGAWPASPEIVQDRFTTPDAPAAPNAHALLPHVTTIKQGGAVNFVIAGFHVVAVYGPGTSPDDIDSTIRMDIPGAPPGFPPIVNDPRNRVYLGLNPLTLPQDRVEVVQLHNRGTYLAVCAFLPHFEDEMWGYVRVVR
jgi:hypothetical protein